MHVSTKHYNASEDASTGAASGGTGAGGAGVATSTWEDDPTGSAVSARAEHKAKADSEDQVDRIIDSEDNEYILSRPHSGFVLVLDPQLVQVRSSIRSNVVWAF